MAKNLSGELQVASANRLGDGNHRVRQRVKRRFQQGYYVNRVAPCVRFFHPIRHRIRAYKAA